MSESFNSKDTFESSTSTLSTTSRLRPNILLCGTPGTGKTTHALRLCRLHSLNHFPVGDIVQKNNCHEGKDEFWDAYIVNERKLLKQLKADIIYGGVVLDWHTCNFFPIDWIDLVVVLRTNHTILWDRLVERKYNLRKIQENNEAEIMQIVLEEAITSFGPERVMVLTSDTLDQVEENIKQISMWIQQWKPHNFPNKE
ncbi:hypothetical protein PNEG_02887 [Pneumocystis murina B123]|uniref:Adenylate kinase isoenzyme 6 homolog n=1 Tax=Pneumocystis murina (strain B123) TaxID=1069680 RepID=M7PE14_PNEMU|nr:hypothetical protein PNEG_02887 [Pneumocystis murina B123]EMR08709.1 hypothetical protein PNEG_02887 [Pneumocystis murina B123]